jgi:hypothetical protein
MADKKDTRPLPDRRVTRLRLVNLGKDPQKMVDVVIPEGTPILRVDRDFYTYGLKRTWVVKLPEEILYRTCLPGLPETGIEEPEPNGDEEEG